MIDGLRLVASGLTWPESPRWREGRLWISDVHNFRLIRLDPDSGTIDREWQVPGRPAGMGFMPDGRQLLATALGRELLWVKPEGGLAQAADLAPLTRRLLNDMVVDGQGRAWVGDTGFLFGSDEPPRPGALLCFHPDRGARVAADNIGFPNGIAITPDGGTLYLAETTANRITAFDIRADGTLANRRIHAELEASPDGLCLDAEGALWVPLLFHKQFHRIAAGGRVLERIVFERENAIACVLGGEDRRTLFLCVSEINEDLRIGAVYARRVDVAGAGLP